MTSAADRGSSRRLALIRILRPCAFIIALVLHAGLAAAVLRQPAVDNEAYEDVGLLISLEIAPTPQAQAAEDTGDPLPDAAESTPTPATPPAPEVEEKLSPEAASDQPKAETTPHDTPPDSLARRETEKKDKDKADEAEATDAAQAQPATPEASSSSASVAGAQLSRDDNQTAAKQQGSVAEARETPVSWQRALIKHLGLHKRYPLEARKRKIEGTATISFRVARDGTVSHVALIAPSGHALLDEETQALLKRAQPLPLLPSDFRASEVQITLPIQYRLR